MAIALYATGWWMWINIPQTPDAVVICVIIFNAAFGYRLVNIQMHWSAWANILVQLGTSSVVIPTWGILASNLFYCSCNVDTYEQLCRLCPWQFEQRVFHCRPRRIGRSITSLVRWHLFCKRLLGGVYTRCMGHSVSLASLSVSQSLRRFGRSVLKRQCSVFLYVVPLERISEATFYLWLLVNLVYPETKGIPLEEMDAVFGEGGCLHVFLLWSGTWLYCVAEDTGKGYLHDYSEQVALFPRGEEDTEEVHEHGHSGRISQESRSQHRHQNGYVAVSSSDD